MRTLTRPPDADAIQKGTSGRISAPLPAPQAHETDPILAAALFAAWSGDPAVVVASPPGAGKTRLVVHLAEQLHRRAGLLVAVAAQTRAQTIDVAERIAVAAGAVGLLGTRDGHRPPALDPRVSYLAGASQLSHWRGIAVTTTARWLWVHERNWTADVCIVDEAWQMTYADLGGLGPLSAQIVLVGDPGQIAPVVTGDARRWQAWAAGPQRAAPEALVAAYPDSVTRLRLQHTWRLGPSTTALIQPAFYAQLPFDSMRPRRYLECAGNVLPELSVHRVTPLAGPGDQVLAATAAQRVREILHQAVVVSSDHVPVPLQPSDVVVITPHVEQAAAVASRLVDLPDVLVLTANQAQGLEREAVVVIHPMAGYREAPAFAVDPGRLCVALSRHRTHATVILDTETDLVLRQAHAEDPHNATIAIQRLILEGLAEAGGFT